MRKAVVAVLAVLALGVVAVPALASHPQEIIPGSTSTFEIDTDANLLIDDVGNDDWESIPQGTTTGTERRATDKQTGQGDDSFGNGSKEDTAVPSVVSGSIPNNKSDLLNFGGYLEDTGTNKYLNIYWRRVQEPTGTTNMDFEFNKSETISGNGVTPVRSEGDVLIQYDLASGGTHPELFLSRWVTTGSKSQCQAANAVPCWGTRVNLSAAGDAVGSINTSAISAADSDGLGAMSARTFGEAQIDFDAFTGGTGCVGFGSAYLKSRSSDSFTAALKDFIAPIQLNFNTCGALQITKTTKVPGTTGPQPQAGVVFSIEGQTGTFTTDANGQICVGGLLPGDYDVTETVPDGYAADGDVTKTVTVDGVGACGDDPFTGDTVSFSNTPLTDLSVTVDSQADGGTASTIDCVDEADESIASGSTDATGDGSASATDLLPGTYVCTVVIDP